MDEGNNNHVDIAAPVFTMAFYYIDDVTHTSHEVLIILILYNQYLTFYIWKSGYILINS